MEAHLLQENVFIRLFVDAGVTALILSFYFREKLGKCFILSVVFVGLLWSTDFITILIYPAVLQDTTEQSEGRNFLLVILSKLFLFFILVILNHIFRHNDIKYMRGRDWLTFLTMPFFSIAITFVFIRNIQSVIGTEMEKVFAGLAFGLVCMNIIMFYFMQSIGKREYLLREKALLELEVRDKLQLYEAISEKVQDQRRVSHEYKNQLTCMQLLCEREEYENLRQYLKQINGDVLHDLDYIDTNQVFVNAVLNAKYEEAVRNHILVVCKVNDLSGLTMAASELVVLLSNLCNNAIEACVKCEGERRIKLKCVYEEDELILSIRNTYNGELHKTGKYFRTTKVEESQSHGIGLRNVIQIIEKNNGYYAIDYTENKFQISIIIPQKIHE